MTDRIFKERVKVEDARQLFLEHVSQIQDSEEVLLEECAGRVLAADIISARNVPHYRRAAMDGYAVRAVDTLGASPQTPVMLELSDSMEDGNCIWVHTGDYVPDEADAVLMVEDTVLAGNMVEIRAQVHPHKNVGKIGEDIKVGDKVFAIGHLLRPCDAAVLALLGLFSVKVFRKPLVAVIPTGDEIVSRKTAAEIPPPGMVLETNGLMSSLYVEKWGGIPRFCGIVPDDPVKIKEAIEANLDANMIFLLGGTSVGKRDHGPEVISSLGKLLVHGIGISPGKPTALGVIGDVPVICLPGYPVAGLVTLYEFARPALRKCGQIPALPDQVFRGRLSAKISSRIGYISFVRVVLEGEIVHPLMGSGAGILSSVAKANAFVLVPENVEGYEAGEEVEVRLIE